MLKSSRIQKGYPRVILKNFSWMIPALSCKNNQKVPETSELNKQNHCFWAFFKTNRHSSEIVDNLVPPLHVLNFHSNSRQRMYSGNPLVHFTVHNFPSLTSLVQTPSRENSISVKMHVLESGTIVSGCAIGNSRRGVEKVAGISLLRGLSAKLSLTLCSVSNREPSKGFY